MACTTVTCASVTCDLRVVGMFACISNGCAVRGHVAYSERSALHAITRRHGHRLVRQHTHTHRLIRKKQYVHLRTLCSAPPPESSARMASLPPAIIFNRLLSLVIPPSVLLLHLHLPLFCIQHCKASNNYFHATSSSVSFDSNLKRVKLRPPFPPQMCKCS